jgi:hypothetical protein
MPKYKTQLNVYEDAIHRSLKNINRTAELIFEIVKKVKPYTNTVHENELQGLKDFNERRCSTFKKIIYSY